MISVLRFTTLLLFVLLLGGCKSLDASKRISKNNAVVVEIKSDDVISSPGISREVVENVANRIKKYTTRRVLQEGIKVENNQANALNTARLAVEITALEVEAKSKAGLFDPNTIRMDLMVLKFSVTVISPSGETLISYDEFKWKESLDDLAQIVAKDAAKSLVRCYSK
jgi:hypothetical protein